MENKIKDKKRLKEDKICLKNFSIIFFLSIFYLLNSSLYIFAQEKRGEKEPIIITSEILTADNKAKTALFEKSVVAKKGDMTLFADRMLVYYSENKDGSSSIKRIDAEGNVKLIKGERVVVSKIATYFSEPEERIIFIGEPRATEGENVVIGSKMTYYLKDDRSVVENSKIMLIDKKGGNTK